MLFGYVWIRMCVPKSILRDNFLKPILEKEGRLPLHIGVLYITFFEYVIICCLFTVLVIFSGMPVCLFVYIFLNILYLLLEM